VIGYSTEFTSVGASDTHDVDVLSVFVNARKYFRGGRRIQPFIGAGLGAATADISGPTITGDTFGLAYQLMAGVEFRVARVGLQVEAKHISAETEDENNEKIDVSGSGIFLGVGLHF
jgi:opacity protein-like surface antigen